MNVQLATKGGLFTLSLLDNRYQTSLLNKHKTVNCSTMAKYKIQVKQSSSEQVVLLDYNYHIQLFF